MSSGSKANAQWGFLKNIVNIDTFFSSGAISSGDAKPAEVKEEIKKAEPVKEEKEEKEEKPLPIKKSISRKFKEKVIDEDEDDDEEIIKKKEVSDDDEEE
jgi:hypothetical protein